MKLENQITSLELSKKLRELGVKQESLFYWTQEKTPKNPNLHEYGYKQIDMPWVCMYSKQSELSASSVFEEYSAYTVAELGELLPQYIVHDGLSCELQIIRSSVWRFYYGGKILMTAGNDDTEANARAKMLIYLLENNLITPNQHD